MIDSEKVIKGLIALHDSMNRNQCYACSNEFIETTNEFGTNILMDAAELIKCQRETIDELISADKALKELLKSKGKN